MRDHHGESHGTALQLPNPQPLIPAVQPEPDS
jgi:hypothetical protein